MQPTSLSVDSQPFRSDGAGSAPRSADDQRMQTCSERVLQALAHYSTIVDVVSESMSGSEPTSSAARLCHAMARAAAAKAIEEMAAYQPKSLAHLSAKQAVLDGSRAFCADNSWLEQLISESVSRDLTDLTKLRKSSPGWFQSVSIPSWSPRTWNKARTASEEA